MRLDFAKVTVSHFKDGGSDIHRIPNITDQRAFQTVKLAEVEEIAPSGFVAVHEEPGRSSSQT